MGRLYHVPLAYTAHTAAGDIVEIIAPASGLLVLHELKLTQSTEAGDSASEQLIISLKRAEGAYTSGSGGSSLTPEPLDPGDVAASFTAEMANTTDAVAGGGSLTTFAPIAESVHIGWHYLPTPEGRPLVAVTDAFLVTLDSTPADSVSIGGYALVEEIGT